jgi:Flp pilus assembly protein TadD
MRDVTLYDRLVEVARRSIRDRDFDAAVPCIEEAIDVDDRRPEAFNLRGVVEQIRGERTEACMQWRVALVLDPRYDPARENLHLATRWPRPPGGLALG